MIMLLLICLSITGCQTNNLSLDNQATAVEHKDAKDTLDTSDDKGVTSSEQEGAHDEGESPFEPWDAKSYLGLDYIKLNAEQLAKVEEHLELINQAEINYNDETADDIRNMYLDLNDLLKTFGLKVAMTSYEDFFAENPGVFNQDEQNEIISLDKKILELNEEDPNNETLDGLYESLENKLAAKGFDAEEIMGQLETGSVVYAKYKYDGHAATLVGDQSKISDYDMEKYNFLIKRAIKVMSPDTQKYLANILINSDGQANILAFVRQENDELTKWRMVLDLKDAFDADGNYIDDFDTTIVHEFAHLLSLNAGQMQKKSNGTYENEEGILAEKAYLNQFYQEFWQDIKADFDEIVDPNDPETAYDFYDKYADQFVSDYAATNPEEDFAETFRVFVYSNKPSEAGIKNDKISWMFDQTNLVKIRDMIRSNYNIQ